MIVLLTFCFIYNKVRDWLMLLQWSVCGNHCCHDIACAVTVQESLEQQIIHWWAAALCGHRTYQVPARSSLQGFYAVHNCRSQQGAHYRGFYAVHNCRSQQGAHYRSCYAVHNCRSQQGAHYRGFYAVHNCRSQQGALCRGFCAVHNCRSQQGALFRGFYAVHKLEITARSSLAPLFCSIPFRVRWNKIWLDNRNV